MMGAYREMLTYIRSAVTRNYSEKCINKILDVVSASHNLHLLQDFYQTTPRALEEAKNEVSPHPPSMRQYSTVLSCIRSSHSAG